MFGKYNMIDWKLWYAFNCPISQYTGRKAAKQGITSHPAVRQGVYQNSVSRDNHLVQFDTVYIGSQRAISNLEKAVKRQFDWQIERDGRGYSEWISGLDVADIESALDKIIDGYKFKVEKVDSKFLPLTTENLEAFIAHYHLENIK
jgi:hypothetical protein